jgi:hypothetical protein
LTKRAPVEPISAPPEESPPLSNRPTNRPNRRRPRPWIWRLPSSLGALGPLASLMIAPIPASRAAPLAPSPLQPSAAAGEPRPRAQRVETKGPGSPEQPAAAPAASAPDGQRPTRRLSERAFLGRLRQDDLAGLADLCRWSAAAGETQRLNLLRQRLLELPMQPVTLPKVLATAQVLLSCRAPVAALTVLDRFSPDRGAGRVQWLLLQWRAAHANLDHRLAARALERLTGGRSENLAALQLVLTRLGDAPEGARAATPAPRRPAIDLLADHLEARGRFVEAAERLLAVARLPIPPGDNGLLILQAQRLQRAVSLLGDLPAAERERLLDPALELAAAAGAWGLVVEMLDDQIRLASSSRPLERRLRLSPRLDDAYGEWRLLQQNPGQSPRMEALERRLRSPRDPGGHAAAAAAAPATAAAAATTPPAAAASSSSAPVAPLPSPPLPALP